MTGGAERWIRRTTTGCVALLALIAATVSNLHMHTLVELHGQPGRVAALTALSVDGMIVAASTALLADPRGGELPWAPLVVGSFASLAANVAVAQPTAVRLVIAAWPSFALISAYEMLMRQVRRGAAENRRPQTRKPGLLFTSQEDPDTADPRPSVHRSALDGRGRGIAGGGAARKLQQQAWQWALTHKADDGSLPSGREIARQYGRHERWGRLVKRSGTTGQFRSEPDEPRYTGFELPGVVLARDLVAARCGVAARHRRWGAA